MSIDIRVEPITKWPGDQTVARRHAPFRAKYSATEDLLERELEAVQAKAIVVQQAITREDLRLDGSVRAGAQPSHPGVILSFTSPKLGKIRFSCDRFFDWRDNLRAIALGMEALRKVDRYGITSDGEQYAGFRAIEAAESARPFETIESAARFIASHARPDLDDEHLEPVVELVLTDAELCEMYFKRAAKELHPDSGGSDVAMARLNAARAMIEKT